MTKEFDEKQDLQFAKTFYESYGLTVEPFSKLEMKNSKTPDRKIFKDGNLISYCEVKSPQKDGWLDALLDEAPPDEIVGGARSDPVFNRISGHVKKAVEQFEAVNPDREVPNILLFINHDENSNFHDLKETLTGYFHSENGELHPTMMNVAEGRSIGERKHRVDLFIWINAEKSTGGPKYFFGSDQTHLDTLCEAFKIDPNTIKRVS